RAFGRSDPAQLNLSRGALRKLPPERASQVGLDGYGKPPMLGAVQRHPGVRAQKTSGRVDVNQVELVDEEVAFVAPTALPYSGSESQPREDGERKPCEFGAAQQATDDDVIQRADRCDVNDNQPHDPPVGRTLDCGKVFVRLLELRREVGDP